MRLFVIAPALTILAVLVPVPGVAQAAECNGYPADLVGSNSNDYIPGDGSVNVIALLDGQDRADGKGSEDWICGHQGSDNTGIGLVGANGPDLILGGSGSDALWGNDDSDALYGDGGPDILVGGEVGDTLRGNDGEDGIIGDDGDDYILGGLDADNLNGGSGDDTLDGGNGKDNCSGGSGSDTLISCNEP